jgi:hypothetical protein
MQVMANVPLDIKYQPISLGKALMRDVIAQRLRPLMQLSKKHIAPIIKQLMSAFKFQKRPLQS